MTTEHRERGSIGSAAGRAPYTPIDLSCDLGEASNAEQQAVEDAIWPLITSANVACGAHAGDDSTMRHAVAQARKYRVRLGAHPSYPDRENFGRRSMSIEPEKLRQSLIDQIRALADLADETLSHVKPHGALYNDAHHDLDLGRTVAAAISAYDPGAALVAAPDSAMARAARDAGIAVVPEAYGDRRYRGDGSLVPRVRADALLLDLDEAAEQALSLAQRGVVTADDGTPVWIVFKTICIHGDMERSVERLQRIRQRLSSAGFSFAAPAR